MKFLLFFSFFLGALLNSGQTGSFPEDLEQKCSQFQNYYPMSCNMAKFTELAGKKITGEHLGPDEQKKLSELSRIYCSRRVESVPRDWRVSFNEN